MYNLEHFDITVSLYLSISIAIYCTTWLH